MYRRMGFASFDLETAKITPKGDNPHAYRPLGIICAGIATEVDNVALYWGGIREEKNAVYNPQMSKDEAVGIVEALQNLYEDGYPPLTWNGVSFDFVILAEESGMWQECFDLALQSYDMMLQFFCRQGYYLGLNRALLAHGLEGKLDDISGADVPGMWGNGEFERVLRYQARDVTQPLLLAKKIAENEGYIRWYSSRQMSDGAKHRRSITPKETYLGELVPVRECLVMPEPDTSWMRASQGRGALLVQWQRAGFDVEHLFKR